MNKCIAVWFVVSILSTASGLCRDVTLKSKPSNAVVYNDLNIKQGVTPLYMGPYFRAKHYQVRKQGYLPQDVTISRGSPYIIEVELQVDPNAKPAAVRPTKDSKDSPDGDEDTNEVSSDTLKRLRALKIIYESGDISEDEYNLMRAKILDSLIPLAPQVSSQSPLVQYPSEPAKTVVEARRFEIHCDVIDSTSEGVSIIGNGDGRVQPGEVFDLVVVVRNVSTTDTQAVTCSVNLPNGNSLKAFSELSQAISQVTAGSVVTNRFNLALPLNAMATSVLECVIEVEEEGAAVIGHMNYELPMGRELP